MISRRDDEIVLEKYIEEEQRRNHPFFGFPLGGRIQAIFFVARRSRYARHRVAPRALNLA
jgi:hypothetical protein